MINPAEHRTASVKHRVVFVVWVGFGVVVLLVGYVGWQATRFVGEETLPTQVSPDGSWSVTISGKRTVFGSIEVTCQRQDSSGTVYGPSVVDSVSSWDELRSRYAKMNLKETWR